MIVYLLQYNNYYNRIVKKEQTVQDYLAYICGDGELYSNPITDMNFIPGDGVIARPSPFNWDGENPDYVIAVENDNTTINSRWFVIESIRTSYGQYQLTLMRDLTADYLDEIMASPCFIEKAILPNDNKLIFNKEDITVSQIKKNEFLLQEAISASVPWIVGYFDATSNPTQTKLKFPAQETTLVSTTAAWGYYKYSNLAGNEQISALVPTNPIYRIRAKYGSGTNILAWDASGGRATANATGTDGTGYITESTYSGLEATPGVLRGSSFTNRLAAAVKPTQAQNAINQFRSQVADFSIASITALDGKTIYFTDTSSAYEITVEQEGIATKTFSVVEGSTVFQDLVANSDVLRGGDVYKLIGTANGSSFDIVMEGQGYKLYLSPITIEEITLDFPEVSTIPELNDAPYKMFCIPFGEINVYNEDRSQLLVRSNADAALKIAQQLAIYGGAWLYDIQLLPYNPYSPGSIPSVVEGEYQLIYSGKIPVSAILFPKTSSFTVNVGNINNINAVAIANNKGNRKLENECDMWRLVSPNGNGVFEFNRAKLGSILNLVAKCTYRPYNPYIQVYPEFRDMYGMTFDKDQRGLICGGDFSLPRTDSAWTNYQLQNKNYEKTFQRQIENLEIQNRYQKVNEIASAIAGTAQGATSGGMVGYMASSGSPIGALAGAAAGMLASGAAGIADVVIGDELRAESIRYAQDQYGYSLGNIQAMPHSLSKVSAFTINNKIFPVLEYYTCSDEEREAVYNKIKYNGMTVMAIGTLGEYRYSKLPDAEHTYLKGRLIRIENIGDDSHIASAIANEIYKGVYI